MKLLPTLAISALLSFLPAAFAYLKPEPVPAFQKVSLTDWTKKGINTIFNAQSKGDFTNAVNAFMAQDIKIEFNNLTLTRNAFIGLINSARLNGTYAGTGAKLTFFNAVEVPNDTKNPTAAGTVGLFFDTTITKKTFRGDKPVSSDITLVTFEVAQDKTVPHSSRGPAVDLRRVVNLNRISPPPTAL